MRISEIIVEGVGGLENSEEIKVLYDKVTSMPKGSSSYEGVRNRAIQHLKNGEILKAKFYIDEMNSIKSKEANYTPIDRHWKIGKSYRGSEPFEYVEIDSRYDEKTALARAHHSLKPNHMQQLVILSRPNKSVAEGEVVPLGKKHRGALEDTHSCVKCGGDLQNGTYMGHKVKVCQPCKQVYLPPNSGIDQQGNKINEQGLSEAELDEAKRKRKRKAKRRSSSPNRSPVPRFYGAWGFGGEGEGDSGGE